MSRNMTEKMSRTEKSRRFWARKYIEARESDGVKMNEFASDAGVHYQSLSRWVDLYEIKPSHLRLTVLPAKSGAT